MSNLKGELWVQKWKSHYNFKSTFSHKGAYLTVWILLEMPCQTFFLHPLEMQRVDFVTSQQALTTKIDFEKQN